MSPRPASPRFGIVLVISIELLPPEAGGRSLPVVDGYRPLCILRRPDSTEATIGMCELRLAESIAPGGSGEGRLAFDVGVTEEVRSLAYVGLRFSLAEGHHRVGTAEVRAIQQP